MFYVPVVPTGLLFHEVDPAGDFTVGRIQSTGVYSYYWNPAANNNAGGVERLPHALLPTSTRT